MRNDLALAYLNRGLARQQNGDLPGAVGDWGLGTGILADLVVRGWLSAAVPLLRGLRWSFTGHRDLADWPGAAAALLGFIDAFEWLQSAWQAGHWMGEVAPLVTAVQGLDPGARAALLAALGERADPVRQAFGWG